MLYYIYIYILRGNALLYIYIEGVMLYYIYIYIYILRGNALLYIYILRG